MSERETQGRVAMDDEASTEGAVESQEEVAKPCEAAAVESQEEVAESQEEEAAESQEEAESEGRWASRA